VPSVKKVAILARNDLFPLAIAQEMEKSAKANGIEVVYFEKYAIGTLDHSAALSQIKSLAPQWIFITGYINDLLLVRKQMVDQQMKEAVMTMIAGPAYQDFIESAGESAENISSASGGIRPSSMKARTFRFDRQLRETLQGEIQQRAGLWAGVGGAVRRAVPDGDRKKPARSIATRCATNSPSSTS